MEREPAEELPQITCAELERREKEYWTQEKIDQFNKGLIDVFSLPLIERALDLIRKHYGPRT